METELDLSNTFHFTSEQVTSGHPDKMCDYISDSLLDAYLEQDPHAKVAIETLVKSKHIVVAGEVTSIAEIDIKQVVKQACRDIGYIPSNGYPLDDIQIIVLIDK